MFWLSILYLSVCVKLGLEGVLYCLIQCLLENVNVLIYLLSFQVEPPRSSSSKRRATTADNSQGPPSYAAKKLCHIAFTHAVHDLVSFFHSLHST